MLRWSIALAFVLAAVAQASAGDLEKPTPPLPPASYVAGAADPSWAGLYIGMNGGYGFGSSSWTDPANPAAMSTGNFNIAGGLLGGTFGANYQAGALVLGVEADVDWSTIKGSITNHLGFCNLIISTPVSTPVAASCETASSWLSTARLRVGYAVDRVLVFATGGAAFGNVQATLTGAATTANAPAPGIFQNTLSFGWTAGAGVEVAISPGWTAKVEYLYVDLGYAPCNTQLSCGNDAITVAGLVSANDSVHFATSMVRVGVNYKFGSW